MNEWKPVKNCPMRLANGNCMPAGGFCTANQSICRALQNAYKMGQRDPEFKYGEREEDVTEK